MSIYSESQKGFDAGAKAEKRPDFITDEHLEFLDELRESGATNMPGARPYIQGKFLGLSVEQAATILAYWMKTFGEAGR